MLERLRLGCKNLGAVLERPEASSLAYVDGFDARLTERAEIEDPAWDGLSFDDR
jgi:hypothetical protein